ncbi:DUF6236 family protein [Kitasatospora sp. NPDC001540]|uniref:DUF6236 family protein n=1 Tax=Kitasatospora sp. NPDC001540 TaxID=3364014 RepID=UPI0036BE3D42
MVRTQHDDRPPGHVAHLYWKEVSPNLREALVQEGLAINTDRPTYEGGNPLGTWISMDPMLAWVYKCALTDELARRNRLLPTTDQIAAHAANEEWSTERISRVLLRGRPPKADDPVTAVLGELAVRMVLPTDMANVPVEKVIELRQKHATEPHSLRAWLGPCGWRPHCPRPTGSGPLAGEGLRRASRS